MSESRPNKIVSIQCYASKVKGDLDRMTALGAVFMPAVAFTDEVSLTFNRRAISFVSPRDTFEELVERNFFDYSLVAAFREADAALTQIDADLLANHDAAPTGMLMPSKQAVVKVKGQPDIRLAISRGAQPFPPR